MDIGILIALLLGIIVILAYWNATLRIRVDKIEEKLGSKAGHGEADRG